MPLTTHIGSGFLNRRIQLQNPLDADNGQGGIKRSWQTVANVWAQVKPISGSEPYFAGQLYPKMTWQITTRYRPNITAAKRIIYGTRTFVVRSVTDVNDQRTLLCFHCDELQAKGSTL